MKINGPIEIMYVVTALCVMITIVLLTGKGSWMIAGYNTASKEEQEKYNEKKLCQVVGLCMSIITLLLLIVCFAWSILPNSFTYVMLAVILVDVVVSIILVNTICRNN